MTSPLRALLFLVAATFASALAANPDAPCVFMAGDSTMADKPLDLPERGWGQLLPEFFKDPKMIRNHAKNGRSTKSFIDEGLWGRLIADVKPGDFVIIQFGHNDEKIDKPAVGTDPATTFTANLRRFVTEVRAKKATPILATPVVRRSFDDAGKLKDTHGAYPDAIRALAKSEGVALLDLQPATAALLEKLGPEPSKSLFMWIAPGTHPKLPEGKEDNTHFVENGARAVARLAVTALREQKHPLAAWLKE